MRFLIKRNAEHFNDRYYLFVILYYLLSCGTSVPHTEVGMVRAVRGATTVARDDAEEITEVTQEMLAELVRLNELENDDLVDIIFTVTPDITKMFPAKAARMMGFSDVPLLDMAAPEIEGALKMCIRVMVHFNTDKKNTELKHVYLRGARVLRPDIVKGSHE